MKSVKKYLMMLFTLAIVVTGMRIMTSEAAAAENAGAAAASGSDEYKVVEKSNVQYDDDEIPVLEGYIFAGWYQDEEAANPYRRAVDSTDPAYAKFVLEAVLGVKAQLSVDAMSAEMNAEKASLRFITTVDTLKYKEVGFQIEINHNVVKKSTRTVYETLYATNEGGRVDKLSPKYFCSASNYFLALTLEGIPAIAWNTEIAITPYWVTLDGTEVFGNGAIKTVNQGRNACDARIGSAYYGTVAQAVEAAEENDTIEVLRDTTLDTTITIDKKVTITNAVGSSVALTRGAGLTDAIFNVTSEGGLTVVCTGANTITLDGTQVEATSSMIVNAGTFELGANASLINGKIADGTDGVYGGALKNEKTGTAIFAGKVNGNTAPSGGAVYNFGGTVTVTGGEFKNNKTMDNPQDSKYGRAGAIYTHNNGITVIQEGMFENNTATGQIGGGVFGGTGYSTLEIKGGSFQNNSAVYTGTKTVYGGGVIQSAGEVTISGGTFSNNTALQGGVIYMDKGTNAKLSISGGTFTSNRADGDKAMGGVIYNAGDSFTITGGEFTGNYAYYRGGVMYIASDNFEQIDISGANFTGNSVDGVADQWHGGGVLYVQGTTVTGTEKKSNRVKIQDCMFENNEAKAVGNNNQTGCGGVIYNTNSYSLNIGTSTFRNNSARLGGAIYIKSNMSLNDESIFENNVAYSCPDIYENQGTIYMNGKVVANIGLNGSSKIQENNILKAGSDIKIRVINTSSITDTGRVVVEYKTADIMNANEDFFALDTNKMGAYELRFVDNKATVYKKQ